MGSERDYEAELLKTANEDLEWLANHYDSLLKEHDNQFLAIHEGKVLASSPRLSALLDELKIQTIDSTTVLIKFVTSSAVILLA